MNVRRSLRLRIGVQYLSSLSLISTHLPRRTTNLAREKTVISQLERAKHLSLSSIPMELSARISILSLFGDASRVQSFSAVYEGQHLPLRFS